MDRVIQVTLAIPHASKSLGGENSSRNRLSDSMGGKRIDVSNDRRAGLSRRISQYDPLMGCERSAAFDSKETWRVLRPPPSVRT